MEKAKAPVGVGVLGRVPLSIIIPRLNTSTLMCMSARCPLFVCLAEVIQHVLIVHF